jgi:hypothetical protein
LTFRLAACRINRERQLTDAVSPSGLYLKRSCADLRLQWDSQLPGGLERTRHGDVPLWNNRALPRGRLFAGDGPGSLGASGISCGGDRP